MDIVKTNQISDERKRMKTKVLVSKMNKDEF